MEVPQRQATVSPCQRQALLETLLAGLRAMEYAGCDSAGVALAGPGTNRWGCLFNPPAPNTWGGGSGALLCVRFACFTVFMPPTGYGINTFKYWSRNLILYHSKIPTVPTCNSNFFIFLRRFYSIHGLPRRRSNRRRDSDPWGRRGQQPRGPAQAHPFRGPCLRSVTPPNNGPPGRLFRPQRLPSTGGPLFGHCSFI